MTTVSGQPAAARSVLPISPVGRRRPRRAASSPPQAVRPGPRLRGRRCRTWCGCCALELLQGGTAPQGRGAGRRRSGLRHRDRGWRPPRVARSRRRAACSGRGGPRQPASPVWSYQRPTASRPSQPKSRNTAMPRPRGDDDRWRTARRPAAASGSCPARCRARLPCLKKMSPTIAPDHRQPGRDAEPGEHRRHGGRELQLHQPGEPARAVQVEQLVHGPGRPTAARTACSRRSGTAR